jgi:hypothetical protein
VTTLTTTPDRVAALHLLESPLLAARTAPYIDGDDIDWTDIYNNVWAVASHSEQVLIDTAFDLFGGMPLRRVSPREAVTVLDSENFNIFCEAILGLRRLLAGCEF